MTRTKLMLAGLIAGALAFGTACKSDKAAEKEPTDQTGGTGGSGDEGGTGGSGDTVDPDYEEDASQFEDSQELGGDKFPSDDTVPQ